MKKEPEEPTREVFYLADQELTLSSYGSDISLVLRFDQELVPMKLGEQVTVTVVEIRKTVRERL